MSTVCSMRVIVILYCASAESFRVFCVIVSVMQDITLVFIRDLTYLGYVGSFDVESPYIQHYSFL